MGNFLVRYDYKVVIYDRRAFIRLYSGVIEPKVVILWTAYLPSTPLIRVQIPLKLTVFFAKYCSKRTIISVVGSFEK